MDKFLVPLPAPKRSRVSSSFGQYERHGVLSTDERARAAHAAFASCAELRSLCLHPSAGARATGTFNGTLGTSSEAHVSGLQFDSQGALLACGFSHGGVHVFDFLSLRFRDNPGGEGSLAAQQPLLRLASGRPVDALRWSVLNQDTVGTVSPADGELHLFDLGVCDSTPTEVLAGEANGRLPTFIRAGLSDLAFFHSSARTFAATSKHAGKVLLWDTRCGLRPRAALAAPRWAGALFSVQVASDDQVLYVSSESGDILCWDLRGGRQAAAFLAANQVHHPLLHTTNVCTMLQEVPFLAEEVDIEPSAVHALAFDPYDARRLAFQLARGWSGVVDLAALCITHVYCPPPPWLVSAAPTAAQQAMWAIRQRPVWTGQGNSLCLGSPATSAVRILDFATSARAGCHVARPPCAPPCRPSSGCRGCRQPVALSTSTPATAVAAHPMCDELVAGTMGCRLLLLASQGKWDSSKLEDEASPERAT